MNPYIYLRALKHAEHTVFCVQDGQKTYFDSQFNRVVAYSSGQQVKRSILHRSTGFQSARSARPFRLPPAQCAANPPPKSGRQSPASSAVRSG